jgi:hypothetical protein
VVADGVGCRHRSGAAIGAFADGVDSVAPFGEWHRKWEAARADGATRLLEMQANPMTLTPRLASPLHTAAGTGNHDVAHALLLAPGMDVNWKNKDNKTPYDTACSNRALRKLIESFGGIPSLDPTGQTARDEPNARKRGAPPSEARQQRAALWQRRRF